MKPKGMNMNTKQLIATVALFAAAGAAFAQPADDKANGFLGSEAAATVAGNATPSQQQNVINRGKTRAEVIAELKQAEQDGTLQVASFAGYRSASDSVTANTAPQAIAHK
jgi:hypothetical protein